MKCHTRCVIPWSVKCMRSWKKNNPTMAFSSFNQTPNRKLLKYHSTRFKWKPTAWHQSGVNICPSGRSDRINKCPQSTRSYRRKLHQPSMVKLSCHAFLCGLNSFLYSIETDVNVWKKKQCITSNAGSLDLMILERWPLIPCRDQHLFFSLRFRYFILQTRKENNQTYQLKDVILT